MYNSADISKTPSDIIDKSTGNVIRRDFFYLLDYVTRRSEIGISKKKSILPNITAKLFVLSVIGYHCENYYFETSLSFGKLC